MKLHELTSYRLLRRLFVRHTLRCAAILFLIIFCCSLLSGHVLVFLSAYTALSANGLNVVFAALFITLFCGVICYLRAWYAQGLRIHTFFSQWEKKYPDTANRLSLIIYAHAKMAEIEKLGYSEELLLSENAWVHNYLENFVSKQKNSLLPSLLFVTLFLVVPTLILGSLQFSFYQEHLNRIKNVLLIRSITHVSTNLSVPAEIMSLRGNPLILHALAEKPINGPSYIHIASSSGWQSFLAENHGNEITYRIESLYQKADFYFSNGTILSNRGAIIPLDPPAVADGTVTITPPSYTGKPTETVPLRPFSLPEGSMVDIKAQSTELLSAAQFTYAGTNVPIVVKGKSITTSFALLGSGEFIISMTDTHGIGAKSMRYPVTVIPDATPTIEILSPPPVSNIPDSFMQRVQLHVRDDYQVLQIGVLTKVNNQETTSKAGLVWNYSPEAAKQVGQATEIYLNYDWDLSQFNLFPGDEMTFCLEALDNDPRGPKKGQSPVYTIIYPTLTDLLKQLDEREKKQVNSLDKVLNDQKQLNQDTQKTLDKIKEKAEDATPDENKKEDTWMEKKELEDIKKRQEEINEQAKKIEETLKDYQKETKENLADKEKEEQGFTPETVEKIDKIHDLMKELVDKDSQQLIEKIEKTVEQMSQSVNPQDLDQLQFSMKDYENQIDRTLSMLQKTFENRQMEGLRKTAEELAQRQDHLQRETNELAKEKDALKQEAANAETKSASGEKGQEQPADGQKTAEQKAKTDELQKKENLLKERQNRMEQDTQDLIQKMQDMQKSMQTESPAAAEMLKKMQEQIQEKGLRNELKQAGAKLAQSKPQEATPHQQKAQQTLQELAEQMQQQMQNMGSSNMEKDTQALRRIADRGLFLSEQMEQLTESTLGQGQDSYALQLARIFQLECGRIIQDWKTIARTNPLMGRAVEKFLQKSYNSLRNAIEVSIGAKWLGLHDTRQSFIALNAAIYEMLQDMQSMQQQMQQQGGSESMKQQMQQLISQQQNLNDMLQQMQQMGKDGQEMMQKMQEMAKQQAKVRSEIEKMMKKFRQVQQLKNQLNGIQQEMREVEESLKKGDDTKKIQEKQKRILSRMLEAGTFQEKDEQGEQRQAEVAKSGREGRKPNDNVPVQLKDKVLKTVERPVDEKIPLQYREAIKNHFIRLSEQLAK